MKYLLLATISIFLAGSVWAHEGHKSCGWITSRDGKIISLRSRLCGGSKATNVEIKTTSGSVCDVLVETDFLTMLVYAMDKGLVTSWERSVQPAYAADCNKDGYYMGLIRVHNFTETPSN
ncbi:MAG: hypothetical protein WCQ53_05450 [bacterium]